MAKKTPQQKAAETRKYNAKVKAGTAARQSFEEANPERFKTVQDHVAERLGNDVAFHEKVRRAGFDPAVEIPRLQDAERRGSARMSYRAMGWDQENGETATANPRQGTLFDHPGTVPNPTPWEDMTPEARAHTTRRLAEFGITPQSAIASHGARIDRGMHQEDGQHASFYSTMGESSSGAKMPKQVLVDAAHENSVTLHTQAAANAATSPQNRAVGRSAFGEVEYPNNEAATHAIRWAQGGGTGHSYFYHPDHYVPPEDKVPHPKTGELVKAPGETRAYPVRGYPANAAKAIDIVHGVEHRGQSVAEAWAGSNNPKAGPFHNAWVAPNAPEGNFTVLDTHELEALAPHATQHESRILSIPGVHAFNDFHKRQAMAQRGLSTVHRTQSLTWRSTKVDEGHERDVAELTVMRRPPEPHTELAGQIDIFGHVSSGAEHAVRAHVEAAHDQPSWTPALQARHEATLAKRRRTGTMLPVDPQARAEGW